MKRSIKHLPKCTQEELNCLLELIKHHIHGCRMIILFGSYARGGYVLWDEKIEFGIHTSYQSDLDILVVISNSNVRTVEQRLREKVIEKYHAVFSHRRHAPAQIIVEDIGVLNKSLECSQYFFTDIIRDGIKMYDTAEVQLAKPRILSFQEIKKIAVDEFNRVYPNGCNLLQTSYFCFERSMNNECAFLTHQVCERFYNTISLVFVNYRPKSHRLVELGAMVKSYSRELVTVFPLHTEFEIRCYDLLCRAYIEARYSKYYEVTKEELAYMLQRTEILKEITERICRDKIALYGD